MTSIAEGAGALNHSHFPVMRISHHAKYNNALDANENEEKNGLIFWLGNALAL
jgi:hypothetical protein